MTEPDLYRLGMDATYIARLVAAGDHTAAIDYATRVDYSARVAAWRETR